MSNYTEPDINRLLAAMVREKLDRVPNFEDIVDPRVTAHIMETHTDPRPQSRGLPPADYVEFTRRTNQDAINVVMDSWPSAQGTIRNWHDLEAMENELVAPEEYRRRMLPYVDAVKNSGLGICANICAPFFVAYMMTGPVPIQDFLLKIYDDPDFAERIMEIQNAHQMQIVEAILDLPISFFIIADDTCSSDGFFCSPEFMNRIWAPRAERLVRLIKQKNIPIMWHCCGKLDQLLPYLVEWNVDCIEPIQPSCNDIYALKEAWGDRLCLKGNISIEGVLAFGTPEETAEDTRNHIDRLSFDGGYIVASSHSIVDAIPPENYRAMIDTAVDYGRY